MSDTELRQDEADRAQMSSSAMDALPDSAFAYVENGGTKDGEGKTVPRSKRHFPIHDAAHVRNALARLPGSPFEKQARPAVEAAAKKMSVMMSSERADFDRPYRPLPPTGIDLVRFSDEFRILSRADGYGDGRTVEAFVTPFEKETPIQDAQGRYREIIGKTTFDRALSKARPQGARAHWNTRVLYNHGMTVHGTPSEAGSMPVGVPLDIHPGDGGLIAVTRYNAGPRGDEILELLASGALGHSFTGRVMRSDPEPGRRGYRPGPDGQLPLVRRLELGLKEYGPTPFPAYDDTGVLGVRSIDLSDAQEGSPDDSDAPEGSSEPSDTSSDGELAPGVLPDDVEHAARLDPDQPVRHAALATRIAVARRTRPGL